MDYEASLDRALADMPDLGGSDERLQLPDPQAQTDGAFTRFTNIAEIADALSREAEHVHSAVQRELGTAGQFESGRARYNGSFTASDFQAALDRYVETYVRCSECGLPDTRLVTEDRTEMLRCEACGAFRPVGKAATTTRTTSTQQRDEIEQGETYELEITGTGRKGDGVAEVGDYTVFVSGAREGETVQALIESTSGDLAFGRKV